MDLKNERLERVGEAKTSEDGFSIKRFLSHILNLNNPHRTTPQQLGLNIPRCNIIPIGDIDGVNNTFEIPEPFKLNSVKLYKGGIRLTPITHYIELNNFIIFLVAPTGGSTLLCDYEIQQGQEIYQPENTYALYLSIGSS